MFSSVTVAVMAVPNQPQKMLDMYWAVSPLSPLLIRSSSSTKVVSRLPLAPSGALMGIRPKILKSVNWTPTLLFVSGIKSAAT